MPPRVLIGSLSVCSLLLISGRAVGQSVDIDLATTKDLTVQKAPDTTRIPPGTYTVRAYNRVPKYGYTITVTQIPIPIEPLQFPSIEPAKLPCDSALANAISQIYEATSESAIPAKIQQIRAALDNVQDCEDLRKQANDLISNDTIRYGTLLQDGTRKDKVVKLRRGMFMVVTVKRTATSGGEDRIWKQVYSTGPSGEWQLNYGLGVPVFFPRPSSYGATQVAAGSTFVITRDQVRSRLGDPVPAAFYTYLPAGNRTVAPGLVAGLGLDLTSPVLFLGFGLTWHSNVQASVGAAFHQEATLLGRYAEGDTISTNLTTDQLTEQVYRIRPYLALTFHFSTNPFSGGAGSGKEGQPEDAKISQAPDKPAPADSASKSRRP